MYRTKVSINKTGNKGAHYSESSAVGAFLLPHVMSAFPCPADHADNQPIYYLIFLQDKQLAQLLQA